MMLPINALNAIQQIRESGIELSRWEKGFIASVNIQAKQGRYLKSAQAEKLNEIHKRIVTDNGSGKS